MHIVNSGCWQIQRLGDLPLHSMGEIRSIGWDLAVEQDDVCFLEGNDSWGGKAAMWLMSDFAHEIARRFNHSAR